MSRRVLAGVVHELAHSRRLRSWLLVAELTARGIPHARSGDAVVVFADGLWFDVYAWLRVDGTLTWVVDRPHADFEDEYPGWAIGWAEGFRFDVGQLPVMWDLVNGPLWDEVDR
ncbi:hypothetical protein [Nocardia wallacei]|uniref:Uncharacterized protein n=1 Tax=Nocardia wallacei TaxID=480035 RepID=A0A7G1KU28_9NOCA|nr:hypothetical protein [Nocardia wallacei]BCK57449.1 hypothetical protein NWFMUON74_52210 [Nocardia wallacei]